MARLQDLAEKEADRIRSEAWPGGIPVDPIRIARRLGIQVFESPLSTNVSAALSKKAGQDPVILLNESDHPNRQRFSCAHEIGHYVKRKDDPEGPYEFVDYRGPLSGAGVNEDEIYANSFGAALLMPASEVRGFKGLDPVQMAVRFKVSQDAMRFRLQNLGLA